jgi:acetylglutamate/LysW-gamma-L-alpha-aminoadipate kinase
MPPVRQQEPITVVKVGGNAEVNPKEVCQDIAALVDGGRQVVVVHGGSAEIDRLADQLGVPRTNQVAPDGVTARHTDAETLQVVTMALAGSVQPMLVRCLARLGIRAMGMTGLDGGLLQARRKRAQRAVVDGRTVIVRDNLAGVVEEVDNTLVKVVLAAGIVPIISPPAITADGEAVNVDADRVAAAVAAALNAEQLVLLTGAAGVQEDPEDERTVLPVVEVAAEGPPPTLARGGMALKLVAAREALIGGVRQVIVADGRRGKPVRKALDGSGTKVRLGSSRGRQSRPYSSTAAS